jgi:hypothetical protein
VLHDPHVDTSWQAGAISSSKDLPQSKSKSCASTYLCRLVNPQQMAETCQQKIQQFCTWPWNVDKIIVRNPPIISYIGTISPWQYHDQREFTCYHLTHWKLFLALAFPGFFLSTTRESLVKYPPVQCMYSDISNFQKTICKCKMIAAQKQPVKSGANCARNERGLYHSNK